MLTRRESMTTAVLSRLFADAITGEVELNESVTKLKYVLLVLDYTDGTAVPHKIEVVVNQTKAIVIIADHGAIGPAVPVDAHCFRQTEAAFFDLEDHLLALGVTVQLT